MTTEAVEVREPRDTASARPVTAAVISRRRFSRPRVVTTLTGRLVRLVWMAVAVVDTLLALDFVFRLIGAHDEGFAHAVYVVGATLASPFNSIFAGIATQFGYVLTWSDAVAVVLCTLAGWVVVRLIRATGPRDRAIA